jgi:CAAX protease family protein
MSSASLFSAFDFVLSAVFLFVGLYVYVSLVKQITVRSRIGAEDPARRFGLPEIMLASLLVSLLLANLAPAPKMPAQLDDQSLVVGILFTLTIVFVIAAVLIFRGFKLDTLGGFSKISVIRAFTIGAILLIAAYPLISLADAITQHFLGSGARQTIVELFSESRSIRQRVLVIVMAVAIAPIAEEFIFRFFLYGVLRRYAGRLIGLTVSAVLFGAAHTHLPSFAPLVVFGATLTIAYEWSGSILVSMAMHSLFNALQLVLLPE